MAVGQPLLSLAFGPFASRRTLLTTVMPTLKYSHRSIVNIEMGNQSDHCVRLGHYGMVSASDYMTAVESSGFNSLGAYMALLLIVFLKANSMSQPKAQIMNLD